MKYFSLFSGIGGFELGIQKAFNKNLREKGWNKNSILRHDKPSISIKSNKRQLPSCVGYSEIDKYAIQIYKTHFPTHKNYGNAKRIIPEKIPDFDLFCAGFPCQSFSIAGKRGGFEDTRGTLFFEIARIAGVKRPRYLLLENVKGLLSHDKGNTFATILSTLDGLGYDCQWCVLNSKDFGVPQNRERVFIIGYIRGESRPEVFPISSNGELYNEKSSSQSSCLKSPIRGRGDKPLIKIGSLGKDAQGNRVYDSKGISATLQGLAGGKGAKTGLYMNTLTGATGNRAGSSKEFLRSVKNIIKAIGQIRRLTPTECERLQGFPDGWTEGISDTQRYKCLGNAVTVNVVAEIVKRLMRIPF